MPAPRQDLVAIVTGSSSGLGQAIVERFARAGAKVCINYHSSAEAAEKIARGIEDGGGEAVVVGADMSDESDVARMFDAVADRFGRVDVLVANAGMQKDAAFADMSLDDWNAVVSLNLTGQFLCAREAVRRFRAQDPVETMRSRGSILFMSSVHDIVPWAGHANYAASKGGSLMLMKSLAQEVGAERIRVNAIAPGAIATDINRDVWEDDAARAKLLELVPYGRIGKTGDVAEAALWLSSDAADYVHGTTLYVDGGMTLYPGFIGNG